MLPKRVGLHILPYFLSEIGLQDIEGWPLLTTLTKNAFQRSKTVRIEINQKVTNKSENDLVFNLALHCN